MAYQNNVLWMLKSNKKDENKKKKQNAEMNIRSTSRRETMLIKMLLWRRSTSKTNTKKKRRIIINWDCTMHTTKKKLMLIHFVVVFTLCVSVYLHCHFSCSVTKKKCFYSFHVLRWIQHILVKLIHLANTDKILHTHIHEFCFFFFPTKLWWLWCYINPKHHKTYSLCIIIQFLLI